MEEFNYLDYMSGAGIEKGDILDVSSDVMAVLMYCRKAKLRFNPNHLLDALQEMVGEEGTVGKDKFEETDKLMVLYTNQEMCVYIPEDIVYTSKDVSVDKDTANTKAEKNNYILYKVEE